MIEVNNCMISLLFFVEHLALFNDGLEFFSFNASLNNSLALAGDNSDFKAFGIGLASCVHAFAEDFDGKDKGLLNRAVFLIIFLEGISSILASFASGVGLPRGVVATRIRDVKLEALDLVKPSVHEGDSERSASTVLSETVFVVSSVLDKLFNHDGLLLLVKVSLSVHTSVIN